MIVKDLIEQLSKLSPTAKVFYEYADLGEGGNRTAEVVEVEIGEEKDGEADGHVILYNSDNVC
jgi:hypothetical protein